MDRIEELTNIFEQSDLQRDLRKRETKYFAKGNFTKLLFEPNIQHLCSIEIHETVQGPYLRIHFKERIDPLLKQKLKMLPGAALRPSSDRVGINLDGDFLILAKGIADVLSYRAPTALAGSPSPIGFGAPGGSRQIKSARLEAHAADELRFINASIWEFANRPENRSLVAKTRSYCTPFRGPLFGEVMQDAVAAALMQRRVDVLILGANPNDVADTGNHTPSARYRSLREQMQTGFYSEAQWDHQGQPVPGWSPFTDSKLGWKFLLQTILRAGCSFEAVTMANYLPWGSKDIQQFSVAIEPELLQRIVGFADRLLIRIVQLLRPRVVIAPFSVTAGKYLGGSMLVEHRALATHKKVIYRRKSGSMTFNVHYGTFMAGDTETMLVHLQHPSSIRGTLETLEVVADQLALILGR